MTATLVQTEREAQAEHMLDSYPLPSPLSEYLTPWLFDDHAAGRELALYNGAVVLFEVHFVLGRATECKLVYLD